MDEDGAVEADGFAILGHRAHEKMSTRSTLCTLDQEVECVGMDVEDHVGCMKSHCGIRMGGKIIEELVDIFLLYSLSPLPALQRLWRVLLGR